MTVDEALELGHEGILYMDSTEIMSTLAAEVERLRQREHGRGVRSQQSTWQRGQVSTINRRPVTWQRWQRGQVSTINRRPVMSNVET